MAALSYPLLFHRDTRFHVVQRLSTPATTSTPIDLATLAADAHTRWTANDMYRDWSHIRSEHAATFRSPELQIDGALHAIVIALAPANPSQAAPLLLWSDQPTLSDGAFARNRRALEPSPSASSIVIRAESLRSDTLLPVRYLFIHVEGHETTTGGVEAVALIDDSDLAQTPALARLSIGPQARDGFVMQTGEPLAFSVNVPKGAELSFGVSAAGAGQQMTIRASQIVDGNEDVLIDANVNPGSWQQHRVKVTASQSLLSFVATASTATTVYWSVPEILAPTSGLAHPNVVLVVVDALRADVLGSYGSQLGVSPFLDKLAGESLVFRRAYAAAPWTKPSIGTLLTSLYPYTHQLGARFYSDPLPDSVPTLQGLLADAGFRTAQVSGNPFSGALSNLDRGFDRVTLPAPAAATSGTFSITGQDINAAVMPWLAEHARDQFFLYAHFVDTHPPYATALAGRTVRAAYENAVRIADRLNVAENTVFIVTADHGEAFGDHGQTGHGQTVYEEEVRVPLIVRIPRQIEQRWGSDPVHLADVMPTILELCGVTPPPDLQGRSLLPAIAGTPRTSQVIVTRFVYPQDMDLPGADRAEATAVIDYPWKFIAIDRDGAHRAELYNLEVDGGERDNRAEAEPLRVRRFATILDGFLKNQASARARYLAAHAPDRQPRPAAPSRELQEQLRTLGYIR
jgi:arylsulfatase A-like enzyme